MRGLLVLSFALGLACITLNPATTYHPRSARRWSGVESPPTAFPLREAAGATVWETRAPPGNESATVTFNWSRVPRDPVRLRIALAHAALADGRLGDAHEWLTQVQCLDPKSLLAVTCQHLRRTSCGSTWEHMEKPNVYSTSVQEQWEQPLRPLRYPTGILDRFVEGRREVGVAAVVLPLIVSSRLAYVTVGPGLPPPDRSIMVGDERARDVLDAVTIGLGARWALHGGVVYLFRTPLGRRFWKTYRVGTEAVANVALRSVLRACWELDAGARCAYWRRELHVFHFEFVHQRIESALDEVRAAEPWFDKDAQALLDRVAELRAG